MSDLLGKVERIWDWPLHSRSVATTRDRRNLRVSADFGAVAGGLLGGGLSLAFAKSDATAIFISFSAVLVGFYGGSLCWKIYKRLHPTL